VNGRIDVIEVLRRANPVPPDTIDENAHPTAGELRASLRAWSTTVPITLVDDEPPTHGRSRWPKYAAAVAAVAALAAGVAALSFVPRDEGRDVDPVTTTETGVGRPAPLLPTVDQELDPGTYAFAGPPVVEGVRVIVTVPAGWSSAAHGMALVKSAAEQPAGMGLSLWAVQDVYTDPCRWMGTAQRPAPSVDALVSALREYREASSPVDIVVDGYPGERVQMQVPAAIDFADCDLSEYRSWLDARVVDGARYHQGPGQIDEVSIVDVDDVRLVIDAAYYPATSEQDLAELRAMVDSIRVEAEPKAVDAQAPAAQEAVIGRLVDAVNSRDADAFIDVFAPDGAFDPRGDFAASSSLFGRTQPVAQDAVVDAWMSIVDAWGLEADLTSCRTREPDGRYSDRADGFLACEVRTRWHTLSTEIAEEWRFELSGDELTWWTYRLVDLDPRPRRLPLGYDGLEAWEVWLERTDPDAAARHLNPRTDEDCEGCDEFAASLAPDDPEFAARLAPLWWGAANDWQIDGHRFSPAGVIPYDPNWAEEIDASIQQYLDTR
jgi:hypothetical protein